MQTFPSEGVSSQTTTRFPILRICFACMTKKHWWVLAAVLAALVLGYWWWKKGQGASSEMKYVTSSVERGSLSATVRGSGNIEVADQATIDPTISGTVENLSVSVGDAVEKGQFLFSISNDQLDVSLANAKSSLMQAENAVFSANIEKDQARNAYNTRTGNALNKNVLKQKISAARLEISAAEESLRAAKVNYAKAVADASKRRVVSPISGTVNEINIKNGDDLGGNSASASKVTPMIIGDLATLKASVDVNEVDVSHIAIGQKASLSLSALGDSVFTGKVEKLNALGSVTSGVVSYAVTVGFDTPDSRLKPGMSVSASIVYAVKSDVLLVPTSAVKSDAEGIFVQAFSDGTPKRVSIETGIASGTDTEIVRGLSEGETIVVRAIPSGNSSSTASTRSSGGFRIPGFGGSR